MLGLVARPCDRQDFQLMQRFAPFAASASCFVVQAALAVILVPPWQNPDEPQHVMSVHQVLSFGGLYRHDVLDEQVEREIIVSMAEHGWWNHYGRPTPVPLPESFADGPGRVIGGYFGPPDGGSRLYYRAIAGLFRVAGIDGLIPQLYAMRLISAAFALIGIACVWGATRAALDPLTAAVVTTAMALHPQFVLVSTTAGPDAAVNLAGAFVWAQTLLLLQAPALRGRHLVGLWAGAFAAFLLRRVGAPLLLVAAVVTGAVATVRGLHLRRMSPMTMAVFLVGLITALALLGGTQDGASAVEWILRNPLSLGALGASDVSHLPGFLRGLYRSFWLTGGWLRYLPPMWWIALQSIVAAVAVAGLVKGPAAPTPRRVVVVAALTIAVQLLALLGLYFVVLRTGAAGRYLFPVLPAAVLLFWVGRRAWFTAPRHHAAAQAFVFAAAVLNVSGWVAVLIPAYV